MAPLPLPGTGADAALTPAAHAPRPRLREVPPRDAPGRESAELWLAVHWKGGTQAQLEALATRAQCFTPRVCLAPPDALLLEVKGSLHLFGGLAALIRAVAGALTPQQTTPAPHPDPGGGPVIAVAPVPRAALTAARAGEPLMVTSLAHLTGRLAPLPLAALGWEPPLLARLAGMGVRTLGQALRLPRAGFARRFGPAALQDLEQLVGREPEVHARHEARVRFRERRDLTYEIEDHERLFAALAPLLGALGRFLESRQLALMELTCLLWHRQGPPGRCTLRLAAPSGDEAQLSVLLKERLGAQALTAPVRACELRACVLVPRQAHAASLWQPGEHGGAPGSEGHELLERLRTRLGETAVYGLRLTQHHRPESAWSATAPAPAPRKPQDARAAGIRGAPPPLPDFLSRRPVWLLRVPQRLSERDGHPWRAGPLQILSEPERIETGWWDGAEVRRDYFTACDARGVRLWIFREHAPPRGWYLHGLFA